MNADVAFVARRLLNCAIPCLLLSAADAVAMEPVTIQARDFSVATGNPSLQAWGTGTRVNVWSMSGTQTNQSIFAVTPRLPDACAVVRVEMLVVNAASAKDGQSAVYKVHLSAIADGDRIGAVEIPGKPVLARVPGKAQTVRTVVLEGGLPMPLRGAALSVRVERVPDDPGDTYTGPEGILQARILPLPEPPAAYVVQDCPGYNSWSFVSPVGDDLLCAYSRGASHTINDGDRGAFAMLSRNGGRTWLDEVEIVNDPSYGNCVEGVGTDLEGAALVWVRCFSRDSKAHEWHHDLYRTKDGVSFEKVSEQHLKSCPMQIMNVFHTKRGLMSLWFATNYKEEFPQFWGTLTSTDNGRTWTQQIVETVQFKRELPTEPSVVNLGGGRILAVARTENTGDSTLNQFQLVSTDDGLTWRKYHTNVADVLCSTPSLVYDAQTGLVSNYYYERGRRALKRRVAKADYIFDHPLEWPAPECVAIGNERSPFDGGNVNAATAGKDHVATFYSGAERGHCSVYAATIPAPSR